MTTGMDLIKDFSITMGATKRSLEWHCHPADQRRAWMQARAGGPKSMVNAWSNAVSCIVP